MFSRQQMIKGIWVGRGLTQNRGKLSSRVEHGTKEFPYLNLYWALTQLKPSETTTIYLNPGRHWIYRPLEFSIPNTSLIGILDADGQMPTLDLSMVESLPAIIISAPNALVERINLYFPPSTNSTCTMEDICWRV